MNGMFNLSQEEVLSVKNQVSVLVKAHNLSWFSKILGTPCCIYGEKNVKSNFPSWELFERGMMDSFDFEFTNRLIQVNHMTDTFIELSPSVSFIFVIALKDFSVSFQIKDSSRPIEKENKFINWHVFIGDNKNSGSISLKKGQVLFGYSYSKTKDFSFYE